MTIESSVSVAASFQRTTVVSFVRTGSATPAPDTDSYRRSGVERRADTLFAALDADRDGAVSEQELTEGAAALLRRAGQRRRERTIDADEVRGDRGGDRGRVPGRLARTLERLFDRIDANQDGTIGRDELTSALARTRRGRPDEPPPPAAGAAGNGAPSSSTAGSLQVTYLSVTYVSVAVQRYTAAQAAAPASTPAGAEAGSPGVPPAEPTATARDEKPAPLAT